MVSRQLTALSQAVFGMILGMNVNDELKPYIPIITLERPYFKYFRIIIQKFIFDLFSLDILDPGVAIY